MKIKLILLLIASMLFNGCASTLKKTMYRSLITIDNTSKRAGSLFKDEKIPLPKLDDSLETKLSDYLVTHYKTPEDYIISKFTDHDIVFLGEEHYIKQNVELIHRMIPKLYENGMIQRA